MRIGNFDINKDSSVFIIAELSANHNHDKSIALETVKAAKEAGADAIKIQTYTPDTITLNVHNDHFKINSDTIWDGKYLYDLYKEAYTPWEWHKEIFDYANELGIISFSSPFDFSAVDFLEDLNVPAYKIASFEITDIPLIEYVASKQKPVIISTGIASTEDIELAVDTCKKAGNEEIILLKCTSSYPAPIEQANLAMVKDLREKYNVISGLSDHTLGMIAPVVATAMGAKVVEKHFILDKSIGGPDASFSLDTDEFSKMVQAIRQAEKSIGKVDYSISEKMEKNRGFSRSLFVSKDVQAGEILTKDNIRSVRPGIGMHPKYYNEILGRKAKKDLVKGEPLCWEDILNNSEK